MIAIVDGGSTKCDWILLDDNKDIFLETQTIGFNPNIIQPELIHEKILDNSELSTYIPQISQLFFYGSGCGVEDNRILVGTELKKVFINADIRVKEDLTAAAYAGYRGVPAIICILGTGSNSCFFDGLNIRKELPSLGFLLGDEGSGNAIGKSIVRDFFLKKLPHDLHDDFDKTYGLSIEDLIRNIYHSPQANAYLAGFNRFVVERKNHPYIQNLLFKIFSSFFEAQVIPYVEARTVEINFIGSIAHVYEDILRAVASQYYLNIGLVIRKPIDNLVRYHLEYIL